MKELFENAEIEVVKFAVEDIITTSGTTTGGGMGGPNEGELDDLG